MSSEIKLINPRQTQTFIQPLFADPKINSLNLLECVNRIDRGNVNLM